MIAFMMRPAALTMASDGCWNNLNSPRLREAVSSSTISNIAPGVVSLGERRRGTVIKRGGKRGRERGREREGGESASPVRRTNSKSNKVQ